MINIFKKQSADSVSHVVAVLLRQSEGMVYVCAVNEHTKQVSVLDERSFHYSNGWESLVYDIDEVLFNIENELNLRMKKAMFFVYSHLVDRSSGELKSTYLDALQTVIKENNLESLGYLELDELLSKTYSELESSLFNAVLVEVDEPAVSTFVYKGGKRTFADSVSRSQDITADVEELLSKFDKESKLPARIIMYDSANPEADSHRLLVHKWKAGRFIQIPKVEVVQDIELKHAITIGLVENMFAGQSVASQMPLVSAPPADDSPNESDDPEPMQSKKSDENILGFAIGADVAAAGPQATPNDRFYPQQVRVEEQTEDLYVSPVNEKGRPSFAFDWQKITSSFKLPSMNFMNSGKRMMPIIIGVVVIGLIGAASYALLYFNHKADVTLLYESEPIEESLDFAEDLNIESVTESFTVTASVSTTGSKDIGEKSKGEITLFNADDAERTFDKGTVIVSPDGLEFVLDTAVTIDGASKTITEDGDVLTSTAKENATVTASDIGPKYNLKKDVKMSIEGLSATTYFARTTKAFTGGTAEQIQTASADDLAKLDAAVEKQIQEQSKKKLQAMTEQRNILESLTSINKTDESYSKEVAEEADTVEAEVTADVTYYSYDEGHVKKVIAEALLDDAPDGYTMNPDNIEYSIASAEIDEETDDISVTVDAVAYPELIINKEELMRDILGKDVQAVQSLVESAYKASGFNADIHTGVPFLKGRIPYFAQNINLELRSVKK